MATYEGLTEKQWKGLYNSENVIDPTSKIILRPLSDIKSHEVVMVCSKAAPLSFTTHEDRAVKKWNSEVDQYGTWTVSCPQSAHHFQVFCNEPQSGGFGIIAYDEDEANSILIEDQSIITDWAPCISYLISIRIDVFNLKRFGFVKWETTPDPIPREPVKSSPWVNKWRKKK